MSISMSLWTYNKSRASVRCLQSATPLTVTTLLIDVKLYNVLEIRFIKNSFRSTMGEDRFNALLLLKYVYGNQVWDMHKPFCRDYFHTFMCKKNCRHPLVDINNINVPGQRTVCKMSAIRNSPDCNHAIDWR
jgi:hypothetical protein